MKPTSINARTMQFQRTIGAVRQFDVVGRRVVDVRVEEMETVIGMTPVVRGIELEGGMVLVPVAHHTHKSGMGFAPLVSMQVVVKGKKVSEK